MIKLSAHIMPATYLSLSAMMLGFQASAHDAAQQAIEWTCSNQDLEIYCDDAGCAVSDVHTPMSVSLSESYMSVCAYTGCWQGAANLNQRPNNRFETYSGSGLVFSTAPDAEADISITVDAKTGIATLLIPGSFAHPMLCHRD